MPELVLPVCDKVIDPTNIPPEDAAALASASPAVCISDHIHENDRVLVLGAGGGVGAHLCQLARTTSKASYICGVSCTPDRLLQPPLNCDDAIDYTKENILESPKYQKEPFDTVIDLSASGVWLKLVDNARSGKNRLSGIVKPASEGGRYITITPDKPYFEAKRIWKLLGIFLFKPLGRMLWYNRYNIFTRKTLPAFVLTTGLPSKRDVITRTLQLAQKGKLKAVVEGPYSFTTDSVRKAFKSLQSRHPKGKVVVKIADFPPSDK